MTTLNLHDILTQWILACVIVAAVGTTSVPLTYSFFPWRTRRLGQLFMLQAVSFAVAIDLTALFIIWTPKNIMVLFWINAIVFTGIAISTSALAVVMWQIKKKGNGR